MGTCGTQRDCTAATLSSNALHWTMDIFPWSNASSICRRRSATLRRQSCRVGSSFKIAVSSSGCIRFSVLITFDIIASRSGV